MRRTQWKIRVHSCGGRSSNGGAPRGQLLDMTCALFHQSHLVCSSCAPACFSHFSLLKKFYVEYCYNQLCLSLQLYHIHVYLQQQVFCILFILFSPLLFSFTFTLQVNLFQCACSSWCVFVAVSVCVIDIEHAWQLWDHRVEV